MAPYRTLLPSDSGQRIYDLREVFDDLRSMVRAGASWRMMPHDLPPWEAGYQQRQEGGSPPAALRRWSTTCYESYCA